MKVTVLEVKEKTNKKSGVVAYNVVVLGKFLKYGDLEMATQTISVDATQFEAFKKLKGQELDLDFVIPVSDFKQKISGLPKGV